MPLTSQLLLGQVDRKLQTSPHQPILLLNGPAGRTKHAQIGPFESKESTLDSNLHPFHACPSSLFCPGHPHRLRLPGAGDPFQILFSRVNMPSPFDSSFLDGYATNSWASSPVGKLLALKWEGEGIPWRSSG